LGQVGAEDKSVLDKIVDSLTSLANPSNSLGSQDKENNISLKVGEFQETIMDEKYDAKKVLILGAGRVCRPAAELLASIGSMTSRQLPKSSVTADFEEKNCVQVIAGSLYLKDAEEVCMYINFHVTSLITYLKRNFMISFVYIGCLMVSFTNKPT